MSVNLTPQQVITLVVLNASINSMMAGIAEAESFGLADCALALKTAHKYLKADHDRLLEQFKRAVQVVTTMPTAMPVIQAP